MAFLQKKGLQDSLGKTLSPSRATERRGVLPSRSGKRSLLDDDFFSKLAEEAEKEDEESDVSEADPMALLESMKDTDDMDEDLFGSKKKTSYTPTPTVAKSARDGDPKEHPTKSKDPLKVPETDDVLLDQKRPSSLAAATRGHRKSNLADMDDPLDDLLDDLGTIKEPKDTKSTVTEKTGLSTSEPQKTTKKEEMGKATPPARAPKKRDELTFDDDEDDLMDALGFGESPKGKTGLFSGKRESEPPPSTTTRLDEILGRGTSPKLLERPPTGEKKDPQQEKNPITKDSLFGEDDFTFGSYQPSMASPLEGRQSRRQSVRFSTEDAGQSPERKPRSAPPSTPTTARPSKPAADWLGLKQEEEEVKSEEPLQAKGSLKPPSSPGPSAESSRPFSGGGATSGAKLAETTPSSPKAVHSAAKPEGSAGQGDDDWLVGALTRKKTLAATRSEEKKPPTPKQRELQGLGEEVDLDSLLSKPSSPAPRRKLEETPAPSKEPRSPLPWETPRRQANSPHLSGPMKEDQPKPVPLQRQREKNTPSVQSQVSLSADSLQPLPVQQQLAQSHHRGLGGTVELGAVLTQRVETEGMASQAYIIHLEGQARSMQLERDQARMLLENIQHRHKQDMELIESKHRTSVKLLEESLAQREARWLQEKQDLAERLATATRLAEQERSELQAQYQRRLSQIQEDRDSEVKRLQELQRKSILEMKKDHEEQVQRLKRLKDEEIDAVTSATSQTRSLTVVIEQMEQFSRRLGDLSSRVESSHEHTAQGLELGARQRDEQLRIMQDRLSQQERAMGEERSRLKEVITKMEAQLAEQQRQLEKERWRVSADQAKAESAQRALEEERRSMMQHISIEREELERAKSALLEEQQAVMKHCAEERRKLTAEWAQFHTQEKQRQEWAEREARRALERDASREGSIISMAQEQADLKLRAAELRQREEAAAREREALQRQGEELEQERERVNAAALRLKTRAQELEGFSKLASERYEEGERALQEARKLETEHLSRLRTIHTQMERLREQEQHLHQEQMRVTDHRREEGLRQGVPFTPLPQSAAPVLPVFASTPLVPPTMVPQPVNPLSSPGSAEMQARLALLRHAAEKDRDFLQDEQFFLETLKKAPYNTTFHTS
ncbi:fas-binding factor 1 isoform X2 [Megalops cyprinoides]|uniref:fas-binding factor 1 isoform X2 n=1 Tax=Megalops cyprinoides TaxID=118141 RepID=UPI001863F260|nr:fas-binding factor 1 isoform X2 [Megalops cyprinoides]